ncbi:MAG: MBL fold metallo-hydrolase [Candidatus Aenigmarchaeota archaeon]|nr:MBL fold metallo-hydrolase [Candidatus Aenigmarchaeota archaeon]
MTSLNLTFLGTGSSIPTLKRNHPTVHLHYQGRDKHSILFDCGEGTQLQLTKAKINFMHINYIFITHWHLDHFIGIFALLSSMGMEGREREINIIGPGIDKINKSLFKFFNFRFKINFIDSVREGIVFENEEFLVKSMKVRHTIETVAYKFVEKPRIKLDKEKIKKLKLTWEECKRIKEKQKIKKDGKAIKLKDISFETQARKLVYSGDTIYLKKMEKFCKGADILVHDCNYFSREDLEKKMHSCLEDVLKFRKLVKKLYLFHIGRKYQSQSELGKKVKKYKNVFVSKDFEKVKI